MSSPILWGPNGANNLQDSLGFGNGSGPIIYGPANPVNPSITATAGAAGSLYLNSLTSLLYQKQDNGTSTNWKPFAGTISANTGVSSANNPTIAANTPFQFDTINFDTTGSFNTTTYAYTAPSTGTLLISVNIQATGASASINVFVNGSLRKQVCYLSSTITLAAGAVAISVIAGDLVTIRPDAILTQANNGQTTHAEFSMMGGVSGTSALGFNFTNWLPYTATLAASFGSASQSLRWRRVGDTIEVSGVILIGVPTSGVATIGLPTGLTIDTSKFTAFNNYTQCLGRAQRSISGGTAYSNASAGTLAALDISSSSSVYLSATTSGSVLNQDPCNTFLSTNDQFYVQFSAPVSGWTSSAFASGNIRTVAVAADTMTLNDLAGTILVNRAGPVTVTLPAHTAGARYTIKDISGAAAINNISIARFGGTGNFEGVAASYVINQNLQGATVLDDGVNYWIVADADKTSGGGSGITRSVSNISIATTLGAAASTDYVALVTGTTTVTLPTAVLNTNLYTLKNAGVATVTVAFTSGQTGDGSSTLPLTPNTSLDLISDNSNWRLI